MQPTTAASLIDLSRVFLPDGEMLQLDRVTRLSADAIVGEMDVGPDHWVYPLHFPGDPIFPGSLMIEAAGQLVAAKAWSEDPDGRPRLAKTSAEFLAPVGPSDGTLVLEGQVHRRRHIRFGTVAVRTAKREIAEIEIVLAVLASG